MKLHNLFEIVVHYLLLRGIAGLGQYGEVPMVSALVCTVTHWIGPMELSHKAIRLSLNLERISSLCQS